MVAVGGDRLSALGPDLFAGIPAFVIAGPPQSGRSNALVTMAASYLAHGTEVVLVTPRSSPLRRLAGGAGVRAVGSLSAQDLRQALAAPGPVVFLIDEAELLRDCDGADELTAIVRRQRGEQVGLVLAGNADSVCGGFSGGQIEAKEARRGLLLSPQNITDADLIGAWPPHALLGRPVTPGRGVLHLGVESSSWSRSRSRTAPSHRLAGMLSRLRSLSPRSTSLAVSGVLLATLVLVLSFLPVPYARLSPGPTTDTLGSVEGRPLIAISGTQTYPVKGRLELTTVSISAPDHRMGLLEAIGGWLNSGVAVVPRENVYETGKSSEDIKQANTQEMALSQKHATHAALTELGIKSATYVVVSQTTEGTPAWGKLHIADRIEKIDGQRVVEPSDVRDLVRKHKPGENVVFVVRRAGKPVTVTIKTTSVTDEGKEVPFVGIQADRDYEFPFSVKIQLDDVGGPSAGLMFALGIVDRLNPEDITGGATVAGTGTIDDRGVVGKIGGISMKILGAKKSGATVFMVPAGNCREALNSPPEGIQLIKVDKLGTALEALTAIRTKQGTVPLC